MAVGGGTMETLVKRLPSENFWHDRRVLITGHTGFKGSWLALWLDAMGARTYGLALPPQKESLFLQAGLQFKDEWSSFGDVRKEVDIRKALNHFEPEVIFHLAAQSLVLKSYGDPVETIDTNVMGTVRLLEAARSQESVKAIVIVTTDKVYRNHQDQHSYKETDELGAADPYSSSKAAADLLTQSFIYSYSEDARIAVSTARAGNVIGGGDYAENRLIPDAVRAWSSGKEFIIRNPSSTRPWQHVFEPLLGYMLLAEDLYSGTVASGAFNFGPAIEDTWSVAKLIDRATIFWPSCRYRESEQIAGPKEASFLHLDSMKSKQKLGYEPRWDLEKALEATITWYKKFIHKPIPVSTLIEQIASFTSSNPKLK
jgi:CDP-glucose 4,6-dehydratase